MAAKKTLTDIERQIKALEDERAKLQKEAQKDAEALISAAANLGISIPETVLVGAILKAKELYKAGDPLVEDLREAGARFLGKPFRRSKPGDAAAEPRSDEATKPADAISPQGATTGNGRPPVPDSDSSPPAHSRPESSDESKTHEGHPAAERSQPPIRLSPERAQGGPLV